MLNIQIFYYLFFFFLSLLIQTNKLLYTKQKH